MMINFLGPLTLEAPPQKCDNSSADTIVYEDICYTRIIIHPENLDIATLTCNNYNGTLYRFDNNTLNVKLLERFGAIELRDPDEYDRFVPHEEHFNLITSNPGIYTPTPRCKELLSDGSLQDVGCNISTNYLCMSG